MRRVLRHLHRLVRRECEGARSDGELLGRFAANCDEAAFEELLRRHAGLVLGTICRLLGHGPDAEDAFQATFLVLVRRAGSLKRDGSLGPWLYTVAYHTALRAREAAARRRREEKQAARVPAVPPDDEPLWRDLRPVLDEELNRLGEKYRAPVVLCYLEGKTHEQAARELGWPLGTVAGRLARAKNLLRQRLARRGVAPSAGALAAEGPAPSPTAVPPALLGGTLSTVLLAPGAGAGAWSAGALALAEGVLKMQLAGRTKTVLLALLALVLTTGTAGVGHLAVAERKAAIVPTGHTISPRPGGCAQQPKGRATDAPLERAPSRSVQAPAEPLLVCVIVVRRRAHNEDGEERGRPVARSAGEELGAKQLGARESMAKPLLTDEIWEQIQPMLPAPKPRRARYPGRKPIEPRKVLTGIVFVLKSGIPWEELPVEMGCGCGMTCLNYLKAWQQSGLWPKMQRVLVGQLAGGDKIDWSRVADGLAAPSGRGVLGHIPKPVVPMSNGPAPSLSRGPAQDGAAFFPGGGGDGKWGPSLVAP
jgi:RNA polymerase sigma factor (sigma-70 family)